MGRRNTSRARRALGWGLLAFVGLQLGLSLAIETVLPHWRDPFYGDKARRWRAHLAAVPTDEKPLRVVMLGSSRTGFGLDAKGLEPILAERIGRPVVAFNFGIPASGPVTHLLYARRLFAEGLRPDCLLIEVLPPLLSGPPGGPPAEHPFLNAERFWHSELPLMAHYAATRPSAYADWWRSELVPGDSLRFQIVGRIVPSWLPWNMRYDACRISDEAGWTPAAAESVTPDEYWRGVTHAFAEYSGHLATFQLGGPAPQALRDLLDLCRREGVPAVLVLMPEGSHFRSWYAPAVNAQLNAFLAGLTREYGAPVIDARLWVSDGGFADSHHMLRPGAEVFTERLARVALPDVIRRGAAP